MTWNSSTSPARSSAPLSPPPASDTTQLRVQKQPDLPQGQVKVDPPGPGDQVGDAFAAEIGQVLERGGGANQNQQSRRLVTLMAPLDTAPSVDDGEPLRVASHGEEVI